MRHGAWVSRTGCSVAVVVSYLLGDEATAQMGQHVIVARPDEFYDMQHVVVFDRRLQEQPELAIVTWGDDAATVASSPAVGLWLANSSGFTSSSLWSLVGDRWIALEPAPHNVLGMAATADGRVVRVGSFEMSAVMSDATLAWSAGVPSGMGTRRVAVGAGGETWIAGADGYSAALWQVDTDSGAIVGENVLMPSSWLDIYLCTDLHPLADGSVWVSRGGLSYEPYMYFPAALDHLVGLRVTDSMPFGSDGAMAWNSTDFAVDGWSRLLVVDTFHDCCAPMTQVVAVDPALPGEVEVVHDFGADVFGLRVGPTGRELFALLEAPGTTQHRRLARLNLETGTHSTVPIPDQPVSPYAYAYAFPPGDATGWTYASAVDTGGDADGDLASNGAETSAGSDPYDPLSRPDGPFIGLSFTPEQAITLTIRDSDGLRDPDQGLDFGSLQVLWNDDQDVLSVLWPFITSVTVTPDWIEGTVVFGGLPLPEDLKWRLEARVADLTGAVGWDWQITPPGDL